jgi:hypothetical protein
MLNAKDFEVIRNILESDDTSLRGLCEKAGGNPATFYQGVDLRGVDLSGEDLHGMDFSGTKFHINDLLRIFCYSKGAFLGANIDYAKIDIADRESIFEFEKIYLVPGPQKYWTRVLRNFEYLYKNYNERFSEEKYESFDQRIFFELLGEEDVYVFQKKLDFFKNNVILVAIKSKYRDGYFGLGDGVSYFLLVNKSVILSLNKLSSFNQFNYNFLKKNNIELAVNIFNVSEYVEFMVYFRSKRNDRFLVKKIDNSSGPDGEHIDLGFDSKFDEDKEFTFFADGKPGGDKNGKLIDLRCEFVRGRETAILRASVYDNGYIALRRVKNIIPPGRDLD